MHHVIPFLEQCLSSCGWSVIWPQGNWLLQTSPTKAPLLPATPLVILYIQTLCQTNSVTAILKCCQVCKVLHAVEQEKGFTLVVDCFNSEFLCLIVPLLRHRNTWEFLKQLALLNEAHYVVIGFRGAEREEKSKMENEEIGRGA